MITDLTTNLSNEQIAEWTKNSTQPLIASGHIGTHLDTYCKTPISLEYFKTKGVLIDVSKVSECREVTIDDVAHMDIPAHSFVLIRTARIERFAYGSEAYFKDHPQLSQDLIKYLIARNIRFIGIDCSGIRCGEEHRDADILCEQQGVYVIENLSHLDQIKSNELTIYTVWQDDPKMTGLKCRVFVEEA